MPLLELKNVCKNYLIGGEIVPMSPELSRHVKARTRLWKIFTRALGDEWFVVSDASLFLAEHIE